VAAFFIQPGAAQQRILFAAMLAALKPGGMLIFEAHAKAQAAFDAKIGLLVEQVLARQFRLDEIPGKISSLGGSMAHMDEEDKQAARELISELKTERSHLQGELEILEAEHAKVEKAGPKAFRR